MSSLPPVRVVVVTHVGSCDFVLRVTDRIGRTRRALAVLLHVADARSVHMTLRGRRLTDDHRRWYVLRPVSGDKLYAGVDAAGRQGPAPAQLAVQPQLSAAQIDAVVQFVGANAGVVESMCAASPELRALQQQYPDLGDPAVLRSVLRAQSDAVSRRLMHAANQVQLTQVAGMQGGAQVLERYAASLMRGVEGPAVGSGSDDGGGGDGGGDAARPDWGLPVARPMPNPWPSALGRAAAPAPPPPPPAHPRAVAIGLPGLMLLLPAEPCAAEPCDGGGPSPSGSATPRPRGPPGAAGPSAAVVPAAARRPPPSSPTSAAGPGFEYAVQLSLLHELGFEDDASCREALLHARGDVQRAVRLLDEWTAHRLAPTAGE